MYDSKQLGKRLATVNAMLNAGKRGFKPIGISEEQLEHIEFLSLDYITVDGEWYSDSEIKLGKLGYGISA